MPVKRHLLYLILAAPIAVTAAPLQCDIGPITKVFGSVPWLLYSCDDGKSLVVVSSPGSAAAPFYFMFSPEGRGYHLRGEGTGSKDLTDAALKELQALSDKDIVGLVGQTIAMRNGAAKR
jgi:hypothetical protein